MFILALISIAAGTLFASFDSMLDPEDISWPNSWVTDMVTLSSNHQGAMDTKATVKFNTPIDLPIGTCAELDLGFSSIFSVVLDKVQAKEKDNELIFTVGKLPNKGVYGPISLKIRQASMGQILAASNNIGIFALIDPEPIAQLNSLEITHIGTSKVASQPASLKFSFTLTSSLNPLDFFFLEFDSSFGIGTLSGPLWNPEASGTAYLNATNFQFKYTSSDHKDTITGIYIYGCAFEVPTSSLVSFSINGFKNPDYEKIGNSYLWTLSVIRFGTKSTLQKYSGTSPADNIAAGPISIIKWEPANGYINTSYIVAESVLFMVLSFNITHALPEEGIIAIYFSSIYLNAYSYKTDETQNLQANFYGESPYAYTDSKELFCETTSYIKVICTVKESMILAGNSQVNVYTLAYFPYLTPSVTDIVSSKSLLIYDKLTSTKTLTKDSTIRNYKSQLIVEPEAYFIELNGCEPVNSAGTSLSGGLYISFFNSYSLSELEITIRAPIIAKIDSTIEDATITPTYTGCYTLSPYLILIYSFYNCIFWGLQISFTKDREIVITILNSFSSGYYIEMIIWPYGSTSNDFGHMKMPYFSTRPSSMHEFFMSYTHDNIFYYYSKPFYFAPDKAFAIFTPACTSAGLPGALAEILWMPFSDYKTYTIIPGYSVYADFTFISDDSNLKGDYGSGLDSGTEYPSSDVGSGNTFIIQYTQSDSDAHSTHFILTYSSPISPDSAMIRFPFPALVSGNVYKFKAKTYAKNISNNDLYILSESESSSITATDEVISVGYYSEYDPSVIQNMQTTINLFNFTIITEYSTGGAGLIFSKGFSLSNSTSYLDYNPLKIYSSDDPKFNFYTAFVGYKALKPPEVSMILTSITLPWYSDFASFTFYAVNYTEFANKNCTHAAKIYLYPQYIKSNNLAVEYYYPKTVIGFGHTSQLFDLEINLKLPGKVRAIPETSFQVYLGYYFNTDGFKWEIKAGNYYSAKGIVKGFYINSLTDTDSSNPTETGQVKIEIPSGTTLEVKIYDIIAPIVTKTTSAIYPGFTSIYVMYNFNFVYRFMEPEDGSEYTTRTTFLVGASAVMSQINSVYAFPNTQGTKDVFLQIIFTTTVDLPKGTVITIKGEDFPSDSSAQDNTWCSEGFSSVNVSFSKLIITTIHHIFNNTIITIRKDKAFNIGSTSTESPVFMIQASYMDVIFLENDESDTGLNKIKYTSNYLGIIKTASLEVDMISIGFASTHKFTFTLNINTNESWHYIFEAPKSYNAHPGPYFEYKAYPGVRYYTASTSISDVNCYGEHWMIICSSIGLIDANTPITLNIILNNPKAYSVDWKLYIVDSNFNHIFRPYSPISTNFVGLPESIFDIYYVNHSQSKVSASDIQIRAKVTDFYDQYSMIAIVFPQPYELKLDNPISISCSHIYETTPPVDVFPEGSICYPSSNSAVFIFQEPRDLSSDYWNTFTFYNIEDPFDGFTRGDDYFDVVDSEVFKYYDYWTRKFTAFSLTSILDGPQKISSISYGNLNAAYTGFFKSNLQPLVINGGENIKLKPGTYSGPITISTSDNTLQTDWINIYPLNAPDFVVFSEKAQYYLTNESPITTFRMGVAPNFPNCIFFLSWRIFESTFAENQPHYRAPPKTYIEIFFNDLIKIQVSEISYAVPRLGTFPIELSIAPYSPFNDLNVKFSLLSPDPNIEFFPENVTFTSEDSVKNFKIAVNESVAIGTVYNFNYTLTGECSGYFEINHKGNFTVNMITTEAPKIETVIDVKSNVEVDLLVSLNTDSIVYWALISSHMLKMHPVMTTLDYIKSYAAPIVGGPEGEQSSIEDQISSWSFAMSQISGNTWEEYNKNFLILSRQMYFAGINFLKKGNYVLQKFSNLIASTDLVFVAWADNLSGNDLAKIEKFGKTDDPLPPALIQIIFDDIPINSSIDAVPQSIAKALGVYSSMVKIWEGVYRRLETIIPCLLLPSVYFYLNPAEKASNLAYKNLATYLAVNGVTSTFIINLNKEAETKMFGTPVFYNSTFILNTNILEFWFTPGIFGIIACVQEINPNNSLTLNSYDILFGLDREGYPAPTSIYSVNNFGNYSVIEWNLEKMAINETYVFSCTICNNYPITPKCLIEEEIKSYSLTWTAIYSYGALLAEMFTVWIVF
ncbi:hypothetical protein SteCoe_36410 [Stentor coeruleus]|uniref:Uncharacterized protein n=1 Tax=Stentor coeruleus TaxID=5963 RepID=A0A1R2AQJ0_9CILI|nr:hypothetical protein SteCoe_36410 [Stentor coeruleus]